MARPVAATNLPQPLTSFVDRQRESQDLTRLLAGHRLVVITGPPGVGKTRLALKVASDVLAEYENGVYLVRLAPLRDPDLVASAIAHAVGVQEMSQQPLLEVLAGFLRDKQMLLVLDNFEHLIEAVPRVARLLARCSRLTLLVTSRERLRVQGEWEFSVGPMGLPEHGASVPPALLSEYGATALFLERVAEHRPGGALTDEDASAVAAICRGLDGLPLAIELTAPRIRLFRLTELLQRLEHPLEVLTQGSRDLPARQRTLRDEIEWSYRLLDAAEQRLFRQLSVFAGGCTREAIEAVGGEASSDGIGTVDARQPAPVSLDALASLVDKNLLRADERTDGEMRFRMLETIRQYAHEQLMAAGEREATAERHARYFMALAEEAEPHLRRAEQCLWLDRLERELDNFRAALEWGAKEPPGEAGLRLASALMWFLLLRGYLGEGRRWLERGLARAGPATRSVAVAAAMHGAGQLAWVQSDMMAADAFYEGSAAMYRELGDERGLAHSLAWMGTQALHHGDLAAARVHELESLGLFRNVGDTWGIAWSAHVLSGVALTFGDLVQARQLVDESLDKFRALGDRYGLSYTLFALSVLEFISGGYEQSAAAADKAVAVSRELGYPWGVALGLMQRALVARHQGQSGLAARLYGEGLRNTRLLGDRLLTAYCIEGLAGTDAARQQPGGTVRILGATEAVREALAAPMLPMYAASYEQAVTTLRGALGEQSFADAWAEGRSMQFEDAVADALALVRELGAAAGEIQHTANAPTVPAPFFMGLSSRQIEVLQLLTAGHSNREIAEALVLSERTVERHVENIYRKIGVAGSSARAAAASYALNHGLAPDAPQNSS